ncbi:PMS1 protein homolog 1-like isoform X2 [Eriocheir sinensis]|uniref:PMS1 protein homolog 1-like isoform X2 n=1 Tax=Eriocheir sinensis TaxID=95602 RepID=UPI0021C65FFC|nr:PMS1 protein homolog 1-like isoform X2 [Eriocheir sinensis]
MVLQALPQDTVRLIKSTQVITSPASIVKELLENSIDAGATAVSIRLENYGFSFLEVRDNGRGIKEEDVQYVAKPHFTSKIQTFADLETLSTYGFRGEALASLCAVAEVSITTKTKESTLGHTYTLDHTGSVSTKKPAAAPNGTTIISRSLFKNLPVRKQYYSSTKRRKEEMKKVEDLVSAFTLAAPEVHLTLSHDKCAVIQKSSVKNIQEALMSTFPAVYKDLVFKERHIEDIHIGVYLPGSGPCDNPNLSRTTPDRLFVLANQRPVIHKSIEKLVKAYYSQKSQGSHGRYPFGVVTLTLPPGAMDVNLEPNKTKILLNDEKQILEAIQEVLSELYGTLDHPKKCNAEDSPDLNYQTDITCTFGGLTKDSALEEENARKNKNADVDDFLDVNDEKHLSMRSEKIWSSSSNQVAAKSAGGGKVALSKLGDRCGKTDEKDPFRRPLQVSQGENENEQGKSHLSFKRTTCDIDELQTNDRNATKKDECQGKSKVVHTSTQQSLEAYFPSIPESSISLDDEFKFFNVSDSSVIKSLENETSGKPPLPLSPTNVLPKSDGSGQNQDTEKKYEDSSPTADQDASKLHESFTGSDGIPVYKIPLLPPFDDTDREAEDDSPVQNIEPMDGGSTKIATEKISLPNADLGDVQPDKPADLEERDKNSAGSWSRGMPINGKNIQTVQLVTTAAHASKTSGSSSGAGDAEKTAKRQAPPAGGSSSVAPPKKLKTNSLGPGGFDYVYGKPVKKPSSPFILFSRDIRGQVLSEHPGADFAFVAKEMADRWKALDMERKDYYRDMSKAEAEKYHVEVRLIKESRGLNGDSPLVKKCKTGASLDRYIAPLTPYIERSKKKIIQQQPLVSHRPWLQHCKEVRCSVDVIKDKIEKRHSKKSNADGMTILGNVTASGGWVCAQGSDIMALNVYRVCEVVLNNNLMKTFELSRKLLENPIPFNSSTVGLENWAALLRLPRELVPHRNFYCVTDQRVTANGLNVVLFPGITSSVAISHGEITEMTDAVGFYGISDLKEILSILTTSPRATLEQTRPLKLQHWIKAESVRMVRSQPNILREDEVLDEIKKLHLMQQGDEEVTQQHTEQKCIHGKPLFTKLYSLAELPMPQKAHLNPGD